MKSNNSLLKGIAKKLGSKDADGTHSDNYYLKRILAKIGTGGGDGAGYDDTEIREELDDKADVGHTHLKADVTDFSHTHTKSEVTDFGHTHLSEEVSTPEASNYSYSNQKQFNVGILQRLGNCLSTGSIINSWDDANTSSKVPSAILVKQALNSKANSSSLNSKADKSSFSTLDIEITYLDDSTDTVTIYVQPSD